MRPNLLIVDDDPDQMRTIVAAAREAGFPEPTRAASAEEAEQRLGTVFFQAAVVDLVLTNPPADEDYPEDGLEVIRLIRRVQPACRIIALTTKLDTEAGIRALDAGAHDFLSSKWAALNFQELLVQRLRLWHGVVDRKASAPA